jgi:hypothetical protein
VLATTAWEDDGAEDAAHRIDQRALPGEHALHPLGGTDEPEQRPDHGGARYDQDGPGHHGRLPGQAQQQAGEHGTEGQGDRHAHHDQPDHDPPGMAVQLPQVQRHARVVEDDGHGQ